MGRHSPGMRPAAQEGDSQPHSLGGDREGVAPQALLTWVTVGQVQRREVASPALTHQRP